MVPDNVRPANVGVPFVDRSLSIVQFRTDEAGFIEKLHPFVFAIASGLMAFVESAYIRVSPVRAFTVRLSVVIVVNVGDAIVFIS